MSFLDLQDKVFLVFGVANRRSVAWSVANILEDEGAKVVFSVRSKERKESLQRLLRDREVFICDVENAKETAALARAVGEKHGQLNGLVHAIAFANFSHGIQPFHETARGDFLQATAISAFSLVEIANSFRPYLEKEASIVSIGISSDKVTAENYGYMSPIKSALEGCVRNLAKSFSAFSQIRFNTVNSGPLKTSASAGIPGYLENYLYAEKLTLRKRALRTEEVAHTVAFLLSPRSSGINGQGIVVNAGMDFNYFDSEVIEATMRASQPGDSEP